jgi:hypothetical protein
LAIKKARWAELRPFLARTGSPPLPPPPPRTNDRLSLMAAAAHRDVLLPPFIAKCRSMGHFGSMAGAISIES